MFLMKLKSLYFSLLKRIVLKEYLLNKPFKIHGYVKKARESKKFGNKSISNRIMGKI